MASKVLLASDGSNHALRATEESIQLAKISNSEIVIAYAVSRDTDRTDELYTDIQNILRPTENLIAQAVLKYTVEILYGDPAEAILEFANKNHFEFLVIGSRGLNKMQEMVMGSVSYQVMKLAECPVLVVK